MNGGYSGSENQGFLTGHIMVSNKTAVQNRGDTNRLIFSALTDYFILGLTG